MEFPVRETQYEAAKRMFLIFHHQLDFPLGDGEADEAASSRPRARRWLGVVPIMESSAQDYGEILCIRLVTLQNLDQR